MFRVLPPPTWKKTEPGSAEALWRLKVASKQVVEFGGGSLAPATPGAPSLTWPGRTGSEKELQLDYIKSSLIRKPVRNIWYREKKGSTHTQADKGKV